ncbi:MAG: T9SS type A sorting domain-containing protein, partial [Saprospiraceae bacterium]|nr:T9SS type A sorting domain-containing protein [Saprospiraceae bacterium]
LQFDPAKVELLEVIPVVGTKDNFGLFQDRVNVSWSAIYPALFLPDESAFRLRIKALAPLHLADVFRLTTEKLHAEAYSESDNPINLRLQFATTAPEATQTIFNPQPNPTSAGIHLPLRLEQSETVTIEILDGTGRLLYQQTQTKGAGTQWLEVPATAFPQAGVYMWRVQAGKEFRTGKVVKQ